MIEAWIDGKTAQDILSTLNSIDNTISCIRWLVVIWLNIWIISLSIKWWTK